MRVKSPMRVVWFTLWMSFILSGTAFAGPPVTWDPGSLEIEIGSGILGPVEVRFRSTEALEGLTAEVVPELAPFISIENPTVASVEPGSDHSLRLSFYLPPATSEGVYEGVLRLRRGQRTIARPLPIVLTVDYGGAVIAPGTRVLSREAASTVLDVSPDGRVLTFQGGDKGVMEIGLGEVLVIPAASLLPAGFLGRVVNLSRDGERIMVVTEPAALSEALLEADVEVEFQFGSESLIGERSIPSLSLAPKGLFEPLEVPLHAVLLDVDNDLETTDDQVRAVGGITLSPDVRLTLEIAGGKVEEFSIAAAVSAATELVVEAELHATFEREIEVARLRFRPIVFWVGWVPIYLQPELTFSVAAAVDTSAKLTAGARSEAALEAGILYDGVEWSTVKDASLELFAIGPTLEASAAVEGRAGPVLSILLYGVVGPELHLYGFGSLTAELGKCPYWWELTAGLNLDAAINMGPFSDLVTGPSYPGLIRFEELLAQAEECGDDEGDGDPPVARGPVCYVDTACSGGGARRVRASDTGECVDVFDCVELWKCPEGPTTGNCGGGTLDCSFSPGCFSDVQDCFFGFCRSIGTCSDRIKYQGYAFDPSANECTCAGNPPAAGGCANHATLSIAVLGAGNVTTDPRILNCGSLNVDCQGTFPIGTTLTLIATPDVGAQFLGWGGDPDCADGIVTIAGDVSCTAMFGELSSVLSRFSKGTGAIGVDDDLDVWLNGNVVFRDEDRFSGAIGPITFAEGRIAAAKAPERTVPTYAEGAIGIGANSGVRKRGDG